MNLVNLKLANFKNYTELDVDFCSNVNCFVGNNGVGKTNLLDAIYYLSFCKSYFNPIDSQNIRNEEPFFAIHGHYCDTDQDADLQHDVSCVLKRGQVKQMKWDKKSYKTFADHIGKIPLVIVSPNDQVLVQGGSDMRRKFIDGVISQTNADYLQHLLYYQKALDQRNRLLKQFYEDRCFDAESIRVWDDQLTIHGKVLYEQRKEFLAAFAPLFEYYYKWISGDKEQPRVVYESLMNDNPDLAMLLQENHRRDSVLQYTSVGPHKDDLDFRIGDYQVKKFGSQGQQKTFLLALKLAQFEYIYKQCGKKPILLLDDVFDKLDMLRVKQLVQLVGSDRFGQVFLTDTQFGRVEEIVKGIPSVECKLWIVEEGRLDER